MAEFSNRQRCRFYIEVIIEEVREFFRMLSQFFRRMLGMGVRKEDNYDRYDNDISSCESQHSVSHLTESHLKTNAQPTYLNFKAHQFDDVNEYIVETGKREDDSDSDSVDEASSSILVNFDHPEIEARAGNELSEFSGIEVLEDERDDSSNTAIASNVLGPHDLSPREYPLPVTSSSEDSIPEWDWGNLQDEYPQDVLKIYFEMLENAKNDPKMARHPAFQTPESFEAYRKIIEAQYKAFLQSEKDSLNRTAAEYKTSGKSSAGSTPKHSIKHSFDKKTEDESVENEECGVEMKVDSSHSDIGPDSDCSEVLISSGKVEDIKCDEDSKTICCSCRKDLSLMPVRVPIEELSSEDEMFEEIREMRRQRELLSKDDISVNETVMHNDETNLSNDKISPQVMPVLQVRSKNTPSCIRLPSFRFKPEVRTKDKYTTTLENYESLSACKLLRCKTGRFLHDYGLDIAVEIRTLRGKTRSVMAIPDRPLGPDFDLNYLYNEPNQVFLYDAPSAFERAAYRMDDHIVLGQGLRKKISPTETAKPKVKRRGIPNKHLKKQTQGNEYMVGYEQEEDEMLFEAPPEEKEEQTMAGVKETEPEEEPKRRSPQMDFRHFEGVPVAVVQKKKGAQDDVEMQYAGTKRKKNKNKKKQQKENQNKDGEKLKNMLLGFDHGERPRGRVRHN